MRCRVLLNNQQEYCLCSKSNCLPTEKIANMFNEINQQDKNRYQNTLTEFLMYH